MEKQEWFAVGALVILALYIGNQSHRWFGGAQNTTDGGSDAPPETVAQQPVIANGQAYYDLHLSLSGTAYNGLSNEYFPLFGFVGARQIS
jgi:hypothetical protein